MSDTNLVVRPATTSDVAVIVQLNETFNDVQATETEIRHRIERLQKIETLLLAEIKQQAVGFLCLRLLPQICSNETYAEIKELFVEAASRRLGVGKALIDEAVKRAKSAGAVEIVLLTNFRNTPAQRFYHAQHFENYAIAMKKRI